MSVFYHDHESNGYKRITLFEGSKCFWHSHQPTVLDFLISLYENDQAQVIRLVDIIAHDPIHDLESNRIFLNYDSLIKFSCGSSLDEKKEVYLLPKVLSFHAKHELELKTYQKIVAFILHHVMMESFHEDLFINLNRNLAPTDSEKILLKNKPSNLPTSKLSHSKSYIGMSEMKLLVERMYRHHLGPSFYFGCDLSICTDSSSTSASSSPSSYMSKTSLESKSSQESSENSFPRFSPPASLKSILKPSSTINSTTSSFSTLSIKKEDSKYLPPLPSIKCSEKASSSKVSPIFPDVRYSPRFDRNRDHEEKIKYLLPKKSFDDNHLLENTTYSRTPCNSFSFLNPQPEAVFFDSEKIFALEDSMKSQHHHYRQHHSKHSDRYNNEINNHPIEDSLNFPKKAHENHLPGLKFVSFRNVPAGKTIFQSNPPQHP